MSPINDIARAVINVLIRLALRLEKFFYRLSTWMWDKRVELAVMEREMVPTWAETVFPFCAAVALVLAAYFVIAMGGD